MVLISGYVNDKVTEGGKAQVDSLISSVCPHWLYLKEKQMSPGYTFYESEAHIL